MQVLSSHTDTYTQVYTYVCTLLSMGVYHRAIPFSLQNVFFYILYIVYWDCRWVHKVIMTQIRMQVGYWAEVRFHRMKYLTNQMVSLKMPFATQTLIFRFKHDLTLAQLFASMSCVILQIASTLSPLSGTEKTLHRWHFKLHWTCKHNTVEMVVYLWFKVMHSVCSRVKVGAVLM